MRALVTGGAGFIGSHVVEDLQAAGYFVTALDNLSTGRRENLPPDVELIHLDIRDGEAVDAAIGRVRPHLISHHAAQTSVSMSLQTPAEDAMTNLVGTIHVLEAACHYDVERLVFASTGGAIYGEIPEGEFGGIARAPAPRSAYACAKLAAESYLELYRQARGLPTVILRYANVYGPRQAAHAEAGVVAIFANHLRTGQPLRINGQRRQGDPGCIRDYVYVGDVVRAHRHAIGGTLDGTIVDIGTGVGTTTQQLALALGQATGRMPQLHEAPPRQGDIARSVLDPRPLVHYVGPPRSLAEGLRETVASFGFTPSR